MLLPITFPTAIPELPLTAAAIDAASSAREVPAATMHYELCIDFMTCGHDSLRR